MQAQSSLVSVRKTAASFSSFHDIQFAGDKMQKKKMNGCGKIGVLPFGIAACLAIP